MNKSKSKIILPPAKLIVFSEIGLHEDIARRIYAGELAVAVIDCKNRAGVNELSKGRKLLTPYSETFHERYVLLEAENIAAILMTQQAAMSAR